MDAFAVGQDAAADGVSCTHSGYCAVVGLYQTTKPAEASRPPQISGPSIASILIWFGQMLPSNRQQYPKETDALGSRRDRFPQIRVRHQ